MWLLKISSTEKREQSRLSVPHPLNTPCSPKTTPFIVPHHLKAFRKTGPYRPPVAPLRARGFLLYKPRTDVCSGRAERPRCSGRPPHASHSEMKAHGSPSCEAKVKKKPKLFKYLLVTSKIWIPYEYVWAFLETSTAVLTRRMSTIKRRANSTIQLH